MTDDPTTPKKDERAMLPLSKVLEHHRDFVKSTSVIDYDALIARAKELEARALRPDPSAGEREEAAKYMDSEAAREEATAIVYSGNEHTEEEFNDATRNARHYRLAALVLRQHGGMVTEPSDELCDRVSETLSTKGVYLPGFKVKRVWREVNAAIAVGEGVMVPVNQCAAHSGDQSVFGSPLCVHPTSQEE